MGPSPITPPLLAFTTRVLFAALLLCALPSPGQGAPDDPDHAPPKIAQPQSPQPEPTQPVPTQPQRINPEPSPLKVQTPDTSTLPKGTVTRVLDTDTLMLTVDGRTLRIDLLGVSAATARVRGDDPAAAAAVGFLEHLLLGETVAIQYDPLGEYTAANKRAAYLFRAPDNQFVNLELVRQGYARHTDSSMSIHLGAFDYYQQSAREHKRGIWDPDRPAPPPAAEPQPQPATQPSTQPPPRTITPQPLTGNDIVYVTKYGKSYHRKDCPHLTDTQRPVHRHEIKDNYKPCKTCKPDAP